MKFKNFLAQSAKKKHATFSPLRKSRLSKPFRRHHPFQYDRMEKMQGEEARLSALLHTCVCTPLPSFLRSLFLSRLPRPRCMASPSSIRALWSGRNSYTFWKIPSPSIQRNLYTGRIRGGGTLLSETRYVRRLEMGKKKRCLTCVWGIMAICTLLLSKKMGT